LTIYWERCDICGRHAPTSLVTFGGKTMRVCYRCSFIFNIWSYRGEPSWKRPGSSVGKDESEQERKIRAIEEMLEREKQ